MLCPLQPLHCTKYGHVLIRHTHCINCRFMVQLVAYIEPVVLAIPSQVLSGMAGGLPPSQIAPRLQVVTGIVDVHVMSTTTQAIHTH